MYQITIIIFEGKKSIFFTGFLKLIKILESGIWI